MKLSLTVIQLITGIILSGLILLQAKGTGLARSVMSGSYHSRRGLEKLTFKATIVLTIIFVLVSATILFV